MQQHGDRFRRGVLRRWVAEQRLAPRQRASTYAIGEHPEMSDAHEAARDDVQEKAAQEFVGVQGQDLHAVVVGVVCPAEPDVTVA